MHLSLGRSDWIKGLDKRILRKVLWGFLVIFSANSYSQLPDDKNEQTISDYLTAIDALEADQGAYSAELSDLFMGLGNAYVSKKEYNDANLVFQRGMQIQRINFGLNSLSQTAYLLSIAETEKYLGDLDQAQKALDQIYSLSAKNYGRSNARMLPVIESLMDWHEELYPLRKPKEGLSTLISLEGLANEMFNVLEVNKSLAESSTPERYKRIGKAQFLIANHIKHYGELQTTKFSVATESSSSTRTEPRTSYKHFRRGRAALQKVVASLMQQQPLNIYDQADAIANLGDWYLIFGQITSATKTYKIAEETMATTERPDELRLQTFESAQLIDFSDGIDQRFMLKTAPAAELVGTIDVSMEISQSGFASDFKVVDENTTLTKSDMKVLQKYFRKMRFRPFFSNGKTQIMRVNKRYDLPSIGA